MQTDTEKKLDYLTKVTKQAMAKGDWAAYNEYYRQYTELALEDYKSKRKNEK